MQPRKGNIEYPEDLLKVAQELSSGRGGCIKLTRKFRGRLQVVGDSEGIMRLGALMLRFGLEGHPPDEGKGTTLHVITYEDVFDVASPVRTVGMVLDERTTRIETGGRMQKPVGLIWHAVVLLFTGSFLFAVLGFVVMMRALLDLMFPP